MNESWIIDHDICMTNDYLNNYKFWKLATAKNADNIFIISFYDFLDRQNDFRSLFIILTIMCYDFLMYLQSNKNFHCHLNKRNTTFLQ